MKEFFKFIIIIIISVGLLGAIFVVLIGVVFDSSGFMEDTTKCAAYTTSKGENFYIKSIKWGMTDDYQVSIITKNKEKLNDRSDTLSAIHGGEPFLYKYHKDTLILVFRDTQSYHIEEHFESLIIKYLVVDNEDFYTNYINQSDYYFP